MNTKFLYGTITSAIKALRKAGFDKDFRLMGNDIGWNDTNMDINDLKIVTVFRYEGNSDPADEASVYGLESKTGLKGILITNDDAFVFFCSMVFKNFRTQKKDCFGLKRFCKE